MLQKTKTALKNLRQFIVIGVMFTHWPNFVRTIVASATFFCSGALISRWPEASFILNLMAVLIWPKQVFEIKECNPDYNFAKNVVKVYADPTRYPQEPTKDMHASWIARDRGELATLSLKMLEK